MAKSKKGQPKETLAQFKDRTANVIEPPPKESGEEISIGSIPPAPPQSDQSHDSPATSEGKTTHEETPECGFRAEGEHAGPVLMRTEKRKLPCLLTVEEKLERGLDLVGTFHKIDAERLRQQQAKKEMAAALTTMEEEQTRLGKAIETGEEDREVDVDLFMLPGNETVSEVRRDTAKPVATRPVTDFERQAFLFGPEKANQTLDHLFDHEPKEGANGATPEQ